MSDIKHCNTCALRDTNNVCPLLRVQVNPDEDFCSKHCDESTLKVCEICGRAIIGNGSVLVQHGEIWHIMCEGCASHLSTCAFCKNNNGCAFEDDPSPLPKMVQKQFRQGNMTTVTTIMNPERIRQTCEKGCDCFSQEFGCMRQFHYCERMNHIYDEA